MQRESSQPRTQGARIPKRYAGDRGRRLATIRSCVRRCWCFVRGSKPALQIATVDNAEHQDHLIVLNDIEHQPIGGIQPWPFWSHSELLLRPAKALFGVLAFPLALSHVSQGRWPRALDLCAIQLETFPLVAGLSLELLKAVRGAHGSFGSRSVRHRRSFLALCSGVRAEGRETKPNERPKNYSPGYHRTLEAVLEGVACVLSPTVPLRSRLRPVPSAGHNGAYGTAL
jgi:hypothetical protein